MNERNVLIAVLLAAALFGCSKDKLPSQKNDGQTSDGTAGQTTAQDILNQSRLDNGQVPSQPAVAGTVPLLVGSGPLAGAFAKLSFGMTRDEALSIMGKPIQMGRDRDQPIMWADGVTSYTAGFTDGGLLFKDSSGDQVSTNGFAEKFADVKMGMTIKEVVARLGYPTSSNIVSYRVLYSYSTPDEKIYTIRFDDGKVTWVGAN